MAIDYGLRRTGIAVTDPLRIIAGALDTVATAELVPYITKYMAENQVDIIVVGMPRRMDGTPSESYEAIAPFVELLRREFADKTIDMFDERFTSVLAHRAMIDGGLRKMQRRDKALVDRISATIILQDYLESNKYKSL